MRNEVIWKLQRRYIVSIVKNKELFKDYTSIDILFTSALFFAISAHFMNSVWIYEYLEWYSRRITQAKLGIGTKADVRPLLEEFIYLCLNAIQFAKFSPDILENTTSIVYQVMLKNTNLQNSDISRAILYKTMNDYAFAFHNLLTKEAKYLAKKNAKNKDTT